MARLLSIPVVVAIVAAGVWVTGAAITNDFRASMALTAVWFGLTGLACVLIARRSRSLRVPVLASYVATVVVIGGYLGLTTVRDRAVDERLAQGAELLSGGFRSEEHDTSGRAAVVRPATTGCSRSRRSRPRRGPTCASASCRATPRTAPPTARSTSAR